MVYGECWRTFEFCDAESLPANEKKLVQIYYRKVGFNLPKQRKARILYNYDLVLSFLYMIWTVFL